MSYSINQKITKAEQQGFTVTKVETPEMSAPSVVPVQIVSTESFQLR